MKSEGGGLRPSRAAYGFTFVSGFQNHVVAHAEAGRSSFVQGIDARHAMASEQFNPSKTC